MEDKRESTISATSIADSPAPVMASARRRAPAKKTAAARKPKTSSPARRTAAARPAARKPAAAKASAARRSSPASKEALEKMLASFSESVSRAGASVSSVSSDGVRAAKRAWNRAGVASKGTVKRVLKEWKELNPRRRASYVAALVGALAAASAPIVRAKMKKR